MALYAEAKDWLQEHGLKGFIRVVEAPHHQEPKKVAEVPHHQGGENMLFREIARVLLEYAFVHPRPPAIPKNRADFIIVTFEGLWVDWPLIRAESLRTTIATIVDGKKGWARVSQWMPKRKIRVETTPQS